MSEVPFKKQGSEALNKFTAFIFYFQIFLSIKAHGSVSWPKEWLLFKEEKLLASERKHLLGSGPEVYTENTTQKIEKNTQKSPPTATRFLQKGYICTGMK